MRQSILPRLYLLLYVFLLGFALSATLLIFYRKLDDSELFLTAVPDFLLGLTDVMPGREAGHLLEEIGRARASGEKHMRRPPAWHIEAWLVDEKGVVLGAMSQQPIPYPWNELPKPEQVNQGLEFRPGHHPFDRLMVRKIGESPAYYLIVRRTNSLGLGLFQVPLIRIIIKAELFLLALGIAVALSIVAIYVRAKSRVAEHVLRELHRGNLRARFPVNRVDEIGRLMLQFNEMADEIERLVARLRDAESARTRLLQELAHDVRTPLFSLSNVIGTLWDNRHRLDAELLEETLQLGRQEVDYFKRLIEDLFLLSQVQDAGYRRATDALDFGEIVRQEIATVSESLIQNGEVLTIRLEDTEGHWPLRGDNFLLRRMCRNALENARKYARSRIDVRLEFDGLEQMRLTIRDDGPGFGYDALHSFGERRNSRFLDTSKKGGLSLGLGSVIMKKIVQAHGGSIAVGNWLTESAQRGGAEICMRLPIDRQAQIELRAAG